MAVTKAGTLMIEHMRENSIKSICTHDGGMSEVGHQLWPDLAHPLRKAARVGQHLRRDSRFKNSLIRAHNINGRPCMLALYTFEGEG